MQGRGQLLHMFNEISLHGKRWTWANVYHPLIRFALCACAVHPLLLPRKLYNLCDFIYVAYNLWACVLFLNVGARERGRERDSERNVCVAIRLLGFGICKFPTTYIFPSYSSASRWLEWNHIHNPQHLVRCACWPLSTLRLECKVSATCEWYENDEIRLQLDDDIVRSATHIFDK